MSDASMAPASPQPALEMSLPADQVCAVVLAGGFGTRIRHLLGGLPKPMAPVNGRPFLEWLVRYLAAQNIRNVILSTGHLSETIEDHFQRQPVAGVKIRCRRETEPLGTAGGFLNAIRAAGEKPAAWLVLNGDSLVLASLEGLLQALDEPGVEGAILGIQVPDASRFGTLSRDSQGLLTGFNEKKPGAGLINAGVYLFRQGVVRAFPQKQPLSFETEVFPELIARGIRLKVCGTRAPFLDIGTPESLPLAEQFIREHAAYFAPENRRTHS